MYYRRLYCFYLSIFLKYIGLRIKYKQQDLRQAATFKPVWLLFHCTQSNWAAYFLDAPTPNYYSLPTLFSSTTHTMSPPGIQRAPSQDNSTKTYFLYGTITSMKSPNKCARWVSDVPRWWVNHFFRLPIYLTDLFAFITSPDPSFPIPTINYLILFSIITLKVSRWKGETVLKISRRCPKNECESIAQVVNFRRKVRIAAIAASEKNGIPARDWQLLDNFEDDVSPKYLPNPPKMGETQTALSQKDPPFRKSAPLPRPSKLNTSYLFTPILLNLLVDGLGF